MPIQLKNIPDHSAMRIGVIKNHWMMMKVIGGKLALENDGVSVVMMIVDG